MFTVAAAAVLVAMVLALARAFAGPSLYDRILAVNVFGTKTVLLIAIVGFLMGRPEFLDIVMVYALMNFITVIGILRFFEYASERESAVESVTDESLVYESVTDEAQKER